MAKITELDILKTTLQRQMKIPLTFLRIYVSGFVAHRTLENSETISRLKENYITRSCARASNGSRSSCGRNKTNRVPGGPITNQILA
jgi:hypothetical protein